MQERTGMQKNRVLVYTVPGNVCLAPQEPEDEQENIFTAFSNLSCVLYVFLRVLYVFLQWLISFFKRKESVELGCA